MSRARGTETVESSHAVVDAPMTIRKVRSSEWVEDGTGSTLAARDYKDTGDLVVEQPAVMLHVRAGVDRDRNGKLAGKGPLLSYEMSATLDASVPWTLFEPKAFRKSARAQSSEVTQQVTAVHASGYGVRRLTPVECERLQSFPDGWTEPSGSDSARYKAMGNAVTVNVVRWILSRLP